MTQQSMPKQSHTGPVSAVAIQGTQMLTGAYDGCLGEWTLDDGGIKLGRFVYLHEKGVNCVVISPDGKLIATGGSDGVACIVKLQQDGAEVIRCSHPGDVESAVFTADSCYLLTGGTDGFARLFSVETGHEVLAVLHGRTVGSMARVPDPGLLATACNDRAVRLIRISDGQVVAKSQAHQGPVKTLGVAAGGILSAGHDNTLLLHSFDLQTVRKIATFTTTPKTLAVEPGGKHFWIGVYDQYTARWTSEGENYFEESATFSSRVWAHGLAASNGVAVAGSFDGSPLVFRSGGTRVSLLQVKALVPCISTACLEPEGSLLAAGDSGEVRRLAASEEVIARVDGAITSIAGNAGDLVAGSWDGEITRLRNGKVEWKAQWPSAGGRVLERAGSPVLRISRANGRVLAGLYTNGWACFRESDGSLLWTNGEATGAVKCVALLGEVFAVTGRYDPLRVGDAATGEVKGRLVLDTPVSDVLAFSPFAPLGRPRIAVCAGANGVWIADLDIEGAVWTLEVVHRSAGHDSPVKALVFTDADTVYAGDYDGRIVRHRVGEPATKALDANCRTGVSSLHALPEGGVSWTTFEGGAGSARPE